MLPEAHIKPFESLKKRFGWLFVSSCFLIIFELEGFDERFELVCIESRGVKPVISSPRNRNLSHLVLVQFKFKQMILQASERALKFAVNICYIHVNFRVLFS